MSYRTASPSSNAFGTWFLHASAVMAGVIMGGIVLLLIVRGYLYWSVRDAAENFKNRPAATQTL